MSESLTLLHISDMQFGRNHRFGRLGLPDLDKDFDTLLKRLTDDLDDLRNGPHQLKPDALIVSGDIAEWGKKSEFDDASQFLEKLTGFLGISRRHVVMVPGNHDINRKLCESYFSLCDGRDELPQAPFWPKWELFVDFFQRFYQSVAHQPDVAEISFVPNQPWSLFEMPELKLVVAGLNSTMAEMHLSKDDAGEAGKQFKNWKKKLAKSFDLSHFGHFGRVGEAQLRWFAEKLEDYQRRGWLRIGVVHHNVIRGASNDDENLTDSDLLKRELGSHLNLLLHGHTHEGKLEWLLPQVPIFATGSAALTSEIRPDEVPNQYQLLRLSAQKVERWTRAFDPRQRRWIAETRSSDSGNDWHTSQSVTFADVSGTFPAAAKSPRKKSAKKSKAAAKPSEDIDDEDAFETARRKTFSEDRPWNSFVDQVEEVCRLRGGDRVRITREVVGSSLADTSTRFSDLPIDYLRVTEPQGPALRQYPVGVLSHSVRDADVEFFIKEVHRPFRDQNPSVTSQLVYAGDRASPQMISEAANQGIQLLSFAEYQCVIDFSGYKRKLVERLKQDVNYPPSLYVTQSANYEIGLDRGHAADAVAHVMEWLDESASRFVLVLADFGTGKSFLQRQLALRIAEQRSHLTPLFIELRTHEKAHSVEEIISAHLTQSKERLINLEALPYMQQQGQIVLLFDGFDELALRTTYEQAIAHFEKLVRAVDGKGKLVLTSRRQFFESDHQILDAAVQLDGLTQGMGFHAHRKEAYKRAALLPGFRMVDLRSFDAANIKKYLLNRLNDAQAAERRFQLIERIKDLLGLSTTPRMLSFIVDLEEEKLLEAERRDGKITSAELYRLLIERWLLFEVDRHQPQGAVRTIEKDDRFRALTQLALKLWERNETTLRVQELERHVVQSVQRLSEMRINSQEAAHIVGSGTLLTRDGDGNFSFAHQSFLEWFVAWHAAEEIQQGKDPQALAVRALSLLMTDFFISLCGDDEQNMPRAARWAMQHLRTTSEPTTTNTSADQSEAILTNAASILSRLNIELDKHVSRAGSNLEGQDSSGQKLIGANLSNTILSGARFVRANLSGAILDGAVLSDADFTGANLTGASLIGVQARRAILNGADLTDARIELADQSVDIYERRDWRYARLVGAKMATSNLGMPALLGAALPIDSNPNLEFLRRSSTAHHVAFSPDGNLLASSHEDGTVRISDCRDGMPLRVLNGHQNAVLSIAFNHDGSELASASSDNSVRIWNPHNAQLLQVLNGHKNPVWSVAFNHDGSRLASASSDNSVRIWNPRNAQLLRVLNGHHDSVWSVAFNHDGSKLASASSDNSIRIWDPHSAQQLHVLNGHQNAVRGIAFNHDGSMLASASSDNSARIWDPHSAQQLHVLNGHQDAVRSVAFNHDGSGLASASSDNSVRIWNPHNAQLLQVVNGHQSPVYNVAFNHDGSKLASASSDHSVRIWNPHNAQLLHTFRGHDSLVFSIAFNRDGSKLASVVSDNSICIWDPHSAQQLHVLGKSENYVRSIAFNHDGSRLASAGYDNSVRIWDVHSAQQLHILNGHQGSVYSVAFNHDGSRLASAGNDNSVRIWNPHDKRQLQVINGHESAVHSVAFNHDSSQLASASSDNSIRVWDPHNAQQLRILNGHQKAVLSVAFNRDGSRLASASSDKSIRVWDPHNAQQLHVLKGHENAVMSIAFNHDGSRLASASYDKSVRIWNPHNAQQLHLLNRHQNPVWSVVFNHDGTRLASASEDGTVRIWDVATGTHLATLLSTTEGWAAFSADGQRYRLGGIPAGSFWYVIGLCRFEPGELDSLLPVGTLQRVPDGEPLLAGPLSL